MKFQIHRLRVGDMLWAQVEEILKEGELIVSFHGDLVRVQNQSSRNLLAGDKVLVRVVQLTPLHFQMVKDGEGAAKGATRIDVSI